MTDHVERTAEEATTHPFEVTAIAQTCGAAAPLVLNGAAFVGCKLHLGHDGQHEVVVRWS